MYDIFSSKSVKLGFMPMAKELAQRNHTVYIVSPIKGNKPITYFNNVVTLYLGYSLDLSVQKETYCVMPIVSFL